MARTFKDARRNEFGKKVVRSIIRNAEVVDGSHLTYVIRGEAWTVIAKRDAKRAARRAARRAGRAAVLDTV